MDEFSIIFDESKAYQVMAEMFLSVKYGYDTAYAVGWVYALSWSDENFAFTFADQILINIGEIKTNEY